jgi:hypothetical protein
MATIRTTCSFWATSVWHPRGPGLRWAVLTAAFLGGAPGCSSSSSNDGASSSGDDSGSGNRGDGSVDAFAVPETGTDASSTSDQAVSAAPPHDSGSAGDAGMEVDVDAAPPPSPDGGGTDAASNVQDAGIVVVPPGCTLPSPVSFTKDVQPFLATSCGNGGSGANAGNGGCHVLDATSTVAAGGRDHAYDWITGTAHASSCPETPTPFRFQVVMAVISKNDPPSCSDCAEMPPANATGANARSPLTACETATLQSWLDEPLVTQTHRADGISPTTPYPMPPFN